jgi:integrase
MASTALNEMGFRSDVIERQLAHQQQNSVRAAYNRAEYLVERRAMMNRWADRLDELLENVVALKTG